MSPNIAGAAQRMPPAVTLSPLLLRANFMSNDNSTVGNKLSIKQSHDSRSHMTDSDNVIRTA